MTVKQMKMLLSNMDDKAECVFAKYDNKQGETVLYYLNHCCNTERQAEYGQVWFSSDFVAMDLMCANKAKYQAEQLAGN